MRKVLIFVCRKEDNAAQKHLSTKLEIKSKQILKSAICYETHFRPFPLICFAS